MRIYCLFEQSNTFRDIWRDLGYQADSYDIEGNPSYKIDLFKEINDCFENKRKTIFDDMAVEDYVLAFFPCTFFETQNQLFFEGTAYQLKNKSEAEKLEIARERKNEKRILPNLFVAEYSGTKPTKTIKGTNYGIERSLISKEFARIFIEEFIIK